MKQIQAAIKVTCNFTGYSRTYMVAYDKNYTSGLSILMLCIILLGINI